MVVGLIYKGKKVMFYSKEWRSSLVSVYFSCFSVAWSVDIAFFPSYFK